ncbi:XylR family transcriptional regulator [Mannheimia granulomatis]|uniref:XylR family transcriptional regulator n=1 Tax=Mannheimia granulomatis TaxID=85402 RepID=UPI00159DE62A|nr:XylR family transcriptional regulator [Mannheimia granulomatis]QLB15847.1 XylR family transcriptional regulator [Mannheimia granulomatis]
MVEKYYKIALLFNANKIYDRGVMKGIGQFIQASQCSWDIFVEDDFVYHKDTIESLSIDGIIADFDDPETAELLKDIDVPIVAVGGSYQNPDYYPKLPYVATDNYALVEAAFLHLKQKGINQFAFYGYPAETEKHWSIERQKAFIQLMEKYEHQPNCYVGDKAHSDNWAELQTKLGEWLQTLPSHTGIIAVTDARARHLLQTCEHLKIAVPEELCVIGIDNEELIQYLSRVSLSSVTQGTTQIGYHAAKLLYRKLNHLPVSLKPILIPPLKIEERRSTDYRSLQDPSVIQAMHFIRHRACQGIKVEQVLDHLRMSRSNLEQRFKDEMNKTVHQVIHEEKLSRAKYMLKFTDIPTQEIAHVCGYPSLQYFYAVFKKEFGKTPKEFRDE